MSSAKLEWIASRKADCGEMTAISGYGFSVDGQIVASTPLENYVKRGRFIWKKEQLVFCLHNLICRRSV